MNQLSLPICIAQASEKFPLTQDEGIASNMAAEDASTATEKTVTAVSSEVSGSQGPLMQGSLNYPFWRYQTIQMLVILRDFPCHSALFGLVI